MNVWFKNTCASLLITRKGKYVSVSAEVETCGLERVGEQSVGGNSRRTRTGSEADWTDYINKRNIWLKYIVLDK